MRRFLQSASYGSKQFKRPFDPPRISLNQGTIPNRFFQSYKPSTPSSFPNAFRGLSSESKPKPPFEMSTLEVDPENKRLMACIQGERENLAKLAEVLKTKNYAAEIKSPDNKTQSLTLEVWLPLNTFAKTIAELAQQALNNDLSSESETPKTPKTPKLRC